MLTELFWINGPWPGRLAIAPRPRGGEWLDQEMKAWRKLGVDVVVSLLTPEEAADLGLEQERQHAETSGIRFLSHPIEDRSVPTSEADTARVLGKLDTELSHGKKIVVHCRQGVGRSGLIAASLLIGRDVSPSEAIQRVSTARHAPVPETPEQRAWIDSFAAASDRRR